MCIISFINKKCFDTQNVLASITAFLSNKGRLRRNKRPENECYNPRRFHDFYDSVDRVDYEDNSGEQPY